MVGFPPNRLVFLVGSFVSDFTVFRFPNREPPYAGLTPPKSVDEAAFVSSALGGCSGSFLPPKRPPEVGLNMGSAAPPDLT